MVDTPSPMAESEARRAAVQQRMEALEAEVARLRQELLALGVEQPLPGLFLTVEVAGQEALLPADAVLEIVRLVDFAALPTASSHVLGTFLYRGTPALAVDVARLLGAQREPDLEAHLVVCGGPRIVALMVDRVRDIVETPLLVSGTQTDGTRRAWDRSGLVAGLCRSGAALLPLLSLGAALQLPAVEGA